MELGAQCLQQSRGGGTWAAASDGQLSHDALQGVAGPVVVIPAQEPTGEGGRLEALLDPDDGRPAVPVGRVGLDVAESWWVRRGTRSLKSYKYLDLKVEACNFLLAQLIQRKAAVSIMKKITQ